MEVQFRVEVETYTISNIFFFLSFFSPLSYSTTLGSRYAMGLFGLICDGFDLRLGKNTHPQKSDYVGNGLTKK
ncbi:hypothetical protein BDQ94DRAFT_130014 [Aspergillus welwitschiae]|uniref:Uncharacterized protein n=1 Tax=Aspergillus welwitschiae TaxID=1341132 RepID=A0A3F3Q9X6_9EURO|nr:hypothetical protein BDQ94DRAFT_130014 [Aspergillus welwitschiae]RDH35612.1 hypothetical protein BDQ94DRAFT_130014 [Aspergillus welwitschiae]